MTFVIWLSGEAFFSFLASSADGPWAAFSHKHIII